MLKKKRPLWVFLLLVLFLAACGNNENATSENDGNTNENGNNQEENEEIENFNETGMPIVNEPITLRFMTGRPPTNADDYNDVLVWQEYNKMTNIEIDWELVPTDALSERRNLAITGGSLPDVFYSASVPDSDLLRYGQQGIFIALNDLIDEYMPNLSKLFEEDPSLKSGMTFPDGNIYSLPTIHDPDYLEVRLGMMFWIRQDWLDALEMDLPETTDEYYEYLKAVKETDLLGDGSGDEIPYGAHNIAGLRDVLKGSFGIGNKGHRNQFVDLDPDTDMPRFFPISDGYKQMLEYIHKLYSEGLIQENIFSIDTNQSFAMGAEGLYGSVVIASPHAIYGEAGDNFVGMHALEGPEGHRQVTRLGSPLNSRGGFVVTSENKHVPETLRWMDHFYSDEGARLFFMGVEGVTYEVDDNGEIDYTDEFYNNPDGLTFDQTLSQYFTWLGGGYPGIIKEEFFKGNSAHPASVEAADRVRPYVEEVWPGFLFTPEENQRLAPIAADIEKYVHEMFDKFVTGDESLDDWDDYVKTIENMRLDEYMEIYNAAYERFDDN